MSAQPQTSVVERTERVSPELKLGPTYEGEPTYDGEPTYEGEPVDAARPSAVRATPLTPADPALNYQAIDLPADTPPRLFVIVDTEEEFDWGARFSSDNTSVRAVRQIQRVHRLLARYGIRPTYVIDFPVASQPDGYRPILELFQSGECAVGAHLHPWVTPPLVEELNGRNSFGCNLGAALEEAKIGALKAVIGDNLGIDARLFKAGRYGFGPTTAAILERLDFDIDASINPRMDYSRDGGPSFEAFDAGPFSFGRHRRLLELPCSTGYTGLARRGGAALHRLASSRSLRAAHLVGVMARLRLVNKVMLSPEGYTFSELRQLTRTLLAAGIRTLTLTFHSPSVEPGHTPYVRTERDLNRFLARIEAYCEFFFGAVGGTAATPEALKLSLEQSHEGARPLAAG